MLFSLNGKSENTSHILTYISANSISSVVSYCENNNIDPKGITSEESILVLNNSASTESYMVTFKMQTDSKLVSYIIYDSLVNVFNFVQSEIFQLRSIIRQDKPIIFI